MGTLAVASDLQMRWVDVGGVVVVVADDLSMKWIDVGNVVVVFS